jgi:4-amino-4-deoxy-L-arabinose transferase-like glycosyltransferase
VAALYALGRARGRPGVGLLAGLILATGTHFPWLARIGRVDMPLTLAVTLSATALYQGRQGQRRALLLGYLAIAAAVLLKGPIGLVLPVAIVAGHLLVEGQLPAVWEVKAYGRRLRELGAWWGVPLVLTLTVPVFVWLNHATEGQFFRDFFWHHNVERGLGGSRLRSHSWWLYGPFFLLYFLPWSPLVLAGLAWAWSSGAWKRDAEMRFGLAWFASVLLVLSCARFKRADYLLPAYPGAALFLACVLARWREACSGQAWLRHGIVAGTAALAGGMVVGWWDQVERVLPGQEGYRDYRAFAAAVREQAPAPQQVLFFRTEAHALAFHVGRPLAILVEWQELRRQLTGPGPRYVVMPPGCAAECATQLPGVRLVEVLRNTDLSGGHHERPLVLLRTAAGS